MGTLFLVATPIGNLEDITARALRVLGEVRLIAAEDTRQTGKLLSHFDIRTQLTSYHEHNKLSKLETVLDALAVGDVALVSDAGTPALNDPGFELVQAALQAGHEVSPIPGPSAPISALVASGLPTDSFLYLGYLPRKRGERQRVLQDVRDHPYTLVFLETPHRLLSALQDVRQVLGDRQMAAARELTKLYEEIFRGSVSDTLAHFEAQKPRGEFTLVIAGKSEEAEELWSEARVLTAVQDAVGQGMTPSQAAGHVSGQSGWPRRKVYRLYLDAKK